ncbi:thiol-disulfide oxidoreductase DCC family protein [Gaetbulibacter saemankumensis]|uniref:thiol-disulfide oxidoreductase DCC family protein n=1 Tax=Gaetbulibacter saemankumensis TaxID=311208 RepID=UPI000486B743|nr:DCC1-like thiol-disulfide oxidoreductase family protein [Gaetbulibacter saemankumensis]
MPNSLPKHKKLILFDGVCNLCNYSVQYVIKHDKNNIFMFSTLQSDIAKTIITSHKIDIEKTDSILLYHRDKGIVTKSTAALKIAYHLKFPNNLLGVFLVIPSSLRDGIYDFIAKNRYRWFGKRDRCMIPTPDLKSKFLE